MNSKSLVDFFCSSRTINILRKFAHTKKNRWGRGSIFYHRFMYIAPSRDHYLLNLYLPLKVIQRRFKVSDV